MERSFGSWLRAEDQSKNIPVWCEASSEMGHLVVKLSPKKTTSRCMGALVDEGPLNGERICMPQGFRTIIDRQFKSQELPINVATDKGMEGGKSEKSVSLESRRAQKREGSCGGQGL